MTISNVWRTKSLQFEWPMIVQWQNRMIVDRIWCHDEIRGSNFAKLIHAKWSFPSPAPQFHCDDPSNVLFIVLLAGKVWWKTRLSDLFRMDLFVTYWWTRIALEHSGRWEIWFGEEKHLLCIWTLIELRKRNLLHSLLAPCYVASLFQQSSKRKTCGRLFSVSRTKTKRLGGRWASQLSSIDAM